MLQSCVEDDANVFFSQLEYRQLVGRRVTVWRYQGERLWKGVGQGCRRQ